MNYSFKFKIFNWIVLISIYLIVIAGSFVRITGSGMGCPDWPKCFGQWVPLLRKANCQVIIKTFTSQKEKRNQKFVLFKFYWFKRNITKISHDLLYLSKTILMARKLTEYVNRLIGFLSGNLMIILFIWMFIKYRIKTLLLQGLNIVLMGTQGWFGSIVVASNLVPWTITVHLFMALLIIGIQIKIVFLISGKSLKVEVPRFIKISILLILIITCYQMFLELKFENQLRNQQKWVMARPGLINGLPFIFTEVFLGWS